MAHYDKGDFVRVEAIFTSGSSRLDPTVIQLEIENPNGLLSTYTYSGGDVVRTSLGVYFYNLFLNQPGQWWYRWYGSGSVISAEEDYIIVDPSEIV